MRALLVVLLAAAAAAPAAGAATLGLVTPGAGSEAVARAAQAARSAAEEKGWTVEARPPYRLLLRHEPGAVAEAAG